MKFKHPADAMRATMLGQLSCRNCAHITAATNDAAPWCDEQAEDPCPGKNFGGTFCGKFKYRLGAFAKKIEERDEVQTSP